MATYLIPIDNIHSQLESLLRQVIRADAFIVHDREKFQMEILDVVFAAERLSHFLSHVGLAHWLPFIGVPERVGVVQGIMRDAVAIYTRHITDQIDYTPNFLLFDYVMVEPDVVAVTERTVELTPQHVQPLLSKWQV